MAINSLTILSVVGCRPNFIKIAPLMAEMKRHPGIRPYLVHTGQHYDAAMSEVFFRDLDIPSPDICLEVGSASHAKQLALMMQRLEGVMKDVAPDLVLVVGDVTSTLAAALTAASLGYPVAHVEAGLRSFDREMPEEINRVLTDSIADYLFATEESAVSNLLREGRYGDQVFLVGNVMIDSLVGHQDKINRSAILSDLALRPREYALVTLHRAGNVDSPQSLERVGSALAALERHVRLVFPVHPRTASRLEQFHVWDELLSRPNLLMIEPLGYIDFMKLMKESAFVMTDSGGVQEESTAFGVPCLTLRDNTERPVTLTQGTNHLVGLSPERILSVSLKVLSGGVRTPTAVPNWDGHAAPRIISILLQRFDEIQRLHRAVRERSCLSTPSPAVLQQA
jgi:UDP-N-acetylglucosamine 2-epimerase (non-hydrolysing)